MIFFYLCHYKSPEVASVQAYLKASFKFCNCWRVFCFPASLQCASAHKKSKKGIYTGSSACTEAFSNFCKHQRLLQRGCEPEQNEATTLLLFDLRNKRGHAASRNTFSGLLCSRHHQSVLLKIRICVPLESILLTMRENLFQKALSR